MVCKDDIGKDGSGPRWKSERQTYLDLIILLSKKGINCEKITLYEAFYIAEEIVNGNIKSAIFENVVFLEKGNETFKNETKNIAKNINYSVALGEWLDLLNDRLERQGNGK